MQPDKKKSTILSKIREKYEERKKLLENEETIDFQETTISVEDLYKELIALKHEIDIENIQAKLQGHEGFLTRLEEDKEILFEMISSYKKQAK